MTDKDIEEAKELFDNILPFVKHCDNPTAVMYAMCTITGCLLAQIKNPDEAFNKICRIIKEIQEKTEKHLEDELLNQNLL
jgi:hypothetical protein